MSRWIIGITLVLLVASSPAASSETCCVLPDNGSGTADLPPNCPPQGFHGHLELIEGLPAGSTVGMTARLTELVIVSQSPGGSLGGTIEVFTATMVLDVSGTGSLSGFIRTLNVPVTGETHSAPRTPGAAVQSFAIEVHRLQGILMGDYDFRLLWFEGGAVYGLDSPGHTTLTREGGPGADFSVESVFEYNYRIQFEGEQESYWIESYRGITLDLQSEFELCPSVSVVGVPGESAVPPAIVAAPNPFRSSTNIGFYLSTPGRTRVEVFDVRGVRVRVLMDAVLPEGPGSVSWDGRNDRRLLVPGGIYFARVAGPEGHAATRVVLLR